MFQKIAMWVLGIFCLWVFYSYNNAAPITQNDFHSATYRVASVGDFSVTYENQGGDTAQIGTTNQFWEYSFRTQPGQFLYVSAQNAESQGRIHCEILVDGRVVKHTESDGGYVIASCSTSAP